MTDSPLILIVDDSLIQRKVFAAALKAAGYRVMVAQDGVEGVAMALQSRPILILMDVLMPEMDGPTAARELRQHPEMDTVPIIAITALSDMDNLETLYQAGFNDVVDKASERSVLLERVRHWISN